MITIDFETRSHADLTKVGSWVYSQDPTTDVICMCYGIDDEPIQDWYAGKYSTDNIPEDLYMAIMTGHTVEAHNVGFEYSIWWNIMLERYGWVEILNHQWRDTMAVACYYGLPAALDKLAYVLKFEGKDPRGGQLITKYSKMFLKTAWKEDWIPDAILDEFIQYCRQDVMIEQSISDHLGDLPPRELTRFHRSLDINVRGMTLDPTGIENASAVVDIRAKELVEEFTKITGFKPTQTAKVIEWFAAEGLKLDSLRAEYLEELLEGDDLSLKLRRVIELRLLSSKASTRKLDKMALCMDGEGKARFQTRYHGTQTGRPTGAGGFQPLNLVRSYEDVDPEQLVRDISHRNPAYLDMLYGDAMEAVSKASRHWIMASESCRIMSGDYSSIEAILLAWLAGEEWKVQAFRNREQIYERMGEKIHGLAPNSITKQSHPEVRYDGKVGELACGYQGALGAWRKFDRSDTHSDEDVASFVKMWRAEHPMICKMWYELERAALDAVARPGIITGYRDIGFEVVDEWLSMILPDDKRIWYYSPCISFALPHWHHQREKLDPDVPLPDGSENLCAAGECDCVERPTLNYMGQKTGVWVKIWTYGGKLTENATQATAREILEPAKERVSQAKYPIILDVYDEIVCDVPTGFGSSEEFKELLLEPAGEWALDIPLNAEVWEGQRYRK